LALVLREYEDEIYFVRPPLFVQKVIFGVLAKVARLLGYQTVYPYPYASERGLPDHDVTQAAQGSGWTDMQSSEMRMESI
jgi:hypothetical protein